MAKRGISKRLDNIDRKLSIIQKEERRIEKEEKEVEKKVNKISKEEKNIERTLLKIGSINIRRRHLYELIRAGSGAFLGVGLGRGLLGLDDVAKTLPWANVMGILIFILGLSTLLIYRDEKDSLKSKGKGIILRKLLFIYAIAIFIEYISLLLFNVTYESTEVLIKILIVGSFTAMASAVTFSLAK